MTLDKPFSQACENNKGPILEQLSVLFTAPCTILEIGTGTGQHAVHFARQLPHLTWQPSDHPQNHLTCLPWLEEAGLANLNAPIPLDVREPQWPVPCAVHGVFSANTAHIMSWTEVELMFHGVAHLLPEGSLFCLYGPFQYQGKHTSVSNAQFDQHLRARDPAMGIRDLTNLQTLGRDYGLELEQDIAMPANNRLTVWRRSR